jgi:hypothetical protein
MTCDYKINLCNIVGCERFSLYDGYARTFEWKGNYDDSKTPRFV